MRSADQHDMDERLGAHLRSWVGQWPPPAAGIHVVGDRARRAPTWDGSIRPLAGVSDGTGTVIGVEPGAVDAVRSAFADGVDHPDLGNRLGHELAVVTEEAARGRGVARRLVATAARRVLEQGAVPTYLHQADNHASARVAEAVGFTDKGWKVHGLWPRGDA